MHLSYLEPYPVLSHPESPWAVSLGMAAISLVYGYGKQQFFIDNISREKENENYEQVITNAHGKSDVFLSHLEGTVLS